MIARAVKTRKVLPGSISLLKLLDESLDELSEHSVVAIASKVVAMCEGRAEPMTAASKDELIARESEFYLPASANRYGVALTVTSHQLVAAAGVDESNGGGHYVLWPSDPQATANEVRRYLAKRFKVKRVGVIITDSTTRPFQWGTTGVSIACSGFEPLRDYIGQPDLFGRPFEYQKNNIQNGLAAAASLVGGEGAEQTPIVVLSELDFVEFVDRDPTLKELDELKIELDDDLYSSFLKRAPWQKGQGKQL